MKANELMIADWVSVQGAGPAQVVMVDQYHVVTTLAKHLTDERKLEAIPITTEILEANGFENYKNIGSIRYFRKDGVKYEEHQGLLYFGRGEIQGIEYIHEMQHALRLIGHDDLADNFKIEKGGNQ